MTVLIPGLTEPTGDTASLFLPVKSPHREGEKYSRRRGGRGDKETKSDLGEGGEQRNRMKRGDRLEIIGI